MFIGGETYPDFLWSNSGQLPRRYGIREVAMNCWSDPGVDASLEAQVQAAYNAGRYLKADNISAAWVERNPVLVDAYHDGQADQYEEEQW